MILDYHMHLRDPDGQIEFTMNAVERYVETASARGVDEIGFTEHVYYFRQTQSIWSLPYQTERCVYDLDLYVAAVLEAKRQGLPVKLGLEVDYVGPLQDALSATLERIPGISVLARCTGSMVSVSISNLESGRRILSTRCGACISARRRNWRVPDTSMYLPIQTWRRSSADAPNKSSTQHWRTSRWKFQLPACTSRWANSTRIVDFCAPSTSRSRLRPMRTVLWTSAAISIGLLSSRAKRDLRR